MIHHFRHEDKRKGLRLKIRLRAAAAAAVSACGLCQLVDRLAVLAAGAGGRVRLSLHLTAPLCGRWAGQECCTTLQERRCRSALLASHGCTPPHNGDRGNCQLSCSPTFPHTRLLCTLSLTPTCTLSILAPPGSPCPPAGQSGAVEVAGRKLNTDPLQRW